VVKRNVIGVPNTHNQGKLNAARSSVDRSNSLSCGEGTGAGLETSVGKVTECSTGISVAGNTGNIGIRSATGSLRGGGGKLLLTTTAIGRGAMPRTAKLLNAAR